jgi:hypothetical protein
MPYSDFTELMWPRKVMVRSWCVHCILYNRIHLADFMFLLYTEQSRQSARLFLQSSELGLPRPLNCRRVCPPLLWFGEGGGGPHACGWGGHFTELMWPRKVTLRSQKISIKWLWPVKVTLKVIKRRLKVFCWSCDGVPLKWNKKIAQPPVCHYGSNEPTLASQYEWSVNTFKHFIHQEQVVGESVCTI